jgi:hypothetical protein
VPGLKKFSRYKYGSKYKEDKRIQQPVILKQGQRSVSLVIDVNIYEGIYCKNYTEKYNHLVPFHFDLIIITVRLKV